MQADAAVYFVGALRQFHNDDCAPGLYQLLYFIGGGDAGNYSQPLFLAGDVQSPRAPAAMKAGMPAICSTGVPPACSFSYI